MSNCDQIRIKLFKKHKTKCFFIKNIPISLLSEEENGTFVILCGKAPFYSQEF